MTVFTEPVAALASVAYVRATGKIRKNGQDCNREDRPACDDIRGGRTAARCCLGAVEALAMMGAAAAVEKKAFVFFALFTALLERRVTPRLVNMASDEEKKVRIWVEENQFERKIPPF